MTHALIWCLRASVQQAWSAKHPGTNTTTLTTDCTKPEAEQTLGTNVLPLTTLIHPDTSSLILHVCNPHPIELGMPWNKIEHNFNSPELDYSSVGNFQECIKVSVFFKKIDSIDHDTFFNHWRTVHADLATATNAFKDHIVRYAQVRIRLLTALPFTWLFVTQELIEYHCSITRRQR